VLGSRREKGVGSFIICVRSHTCDGLLWGESMRPLHAFAQFQAAAKSSAQLDVVLHFYERSILYLLGTNRNRYGIRNLGYAGESMRPLHVFAQGMRRTRADRLAQALYRYCCTGVQQQQITNNNDQQYDPQHKHNSLEQVSSKTMIKASLL
jgi:hypothetical protein